MAQPRRPSRAATTRFPDARTIPRRRSRSASPVTAKSFSCSTSRWSRSPPVRSGSCISAAWGSAPGTGETPRRPRTRSGRTRTPRADRDASTRPRPCQDRPRRPRPLPRAHRLSDQESGYRIELGEIEAALNAARGLRECAVVAIASDGFEGTTICCAYVPTPGALVTPAALRSEVSRALPPYMLPARWMAFDSFPKNANGKTDRRRLKEAFEAHAAEPIDSPELLHLVAAGWPKKRTTSGWTSATASRSSARRGSRS